MSYLIAEFFRKIVYSYYLVKLFIIKDRDYLRFSVIIPIYNRAHVIDYALKSIYKQRFIPQENIQIIVIDDGSTDHISDLMRSHKKVTFLKMEHSGIIGIVRNAGLKKVSNEIICYLDSDDYWLPLHLAILSYYYKKNSDIAFVSTRATCEYLDFRKGKRFVLRRKNPPYKSYPVTNCISHRRICYEKLGGFGKASFGEDAIYWSKIKKYYKNQHIKIKTAVYTFTKDGNNITYKFHPISKIE